MSDPVVNTQRPMAIAAFVRGECPRCRARTLYDGLLRFAARCRSCSLDFECFNVGDGPAAFLTLIVGAIVVLGAVLLEVFAEPPFWVHALIWPALSAVLVVGGLRVAKAWLLTAEYRNAAREGRIAP